jgi:hypothetical protein
MTDIVPGGTASTAKGRILYTGEARRAVALPLGGLGAGHVSVAGDGSLRQWQLANTINHSGYVPDSFFALRVAGFEPPLDVRRTLRSEALPALAEPAPLVTDHLAPQDPHPPTDVWPAVPTTEMSVAYPFATVGFHDPELPVDVEFDAWTPFVPLDAEASSLPLAAFTFQLTNRVDQPIHGWLVASLQNAVGWDGVTPIEGGRCSLYGGNQNEIVGLGPDGWPAILMTNESLVPSSPRAGEMLIAADRQAVRIPRATSSRSILMFAESLKLLRPGIADDWSRVAIDNDLHDMRLPFAMPDGPSPYGSTWTGALAIPFALARGETTSIEVVHAWWFPNRVADFDQFGIGLPVPDPPPLLGNRYADRFSGARDVATTFFADRERLFEISRRWSVALTSLDAPAPVAQTLAAQPALVRSPTTFIDFDGRLLGFEGCLGASTLNWNGAIGGSCPLNCSHVWNYEQAIASIFPDLERSMRAIDWDVLQAPSGAMTHRLRVPADGPQLFAQPIGGPLDPALDGMLGAVLKTYREARLGGGRGILDQRWQAMRRLMGHVEATWDPRGTGILDGPQPMTYDISLTQPNAFIGGLWIAALMVMERVARILGHRAEATRYSDQAAQARHAYDVALWNGQYFGRAYDSDVSGLGSGCLTDQLNGQWWAHQLGLGHLFPVEHVRTALRSIVRHNLRRGFRDFDHGFRSFADADDTGLVICSWPQGDRPVVPVRYADEVWSGIEYAFAALCLFEGLEEEGLEVLAAVRARSDGTRRNPYNEIECGDHYSRAMSGWSLLQAWTGNSVDVIEGLIRLGCRPGNAPWMGGTAWGTTNVSTGRAVLEVIGGSFMLETICCEAQPGDQGVSVRLRIDDQPVPARVSTATGGITASLQSPMEVVAGSSLELVW